jgi:hypothetical protein
MLVPNKVILWPEDRHAITAIPKLGLISRRKPASESEQAFRLSMIELKAPVSPK